jgi:hypothetical protein
MLAPSKANAHLPLPCEGTLPRENSTAQARGGLPDRVLHCGISAPSADGFMAEMGRLPPRADYTCPSHAARNGSIPANCARLPR